MPDSTSIPSPRLLVPPKFGTVFMPLGLVVLIGALDYATGQDFAFSAFYLVPVCWAGWAAGRTAGLALAVGSSVIWLVAECLTGQAYRHPALPYFNALTLLLLLLAVAYVLSEIRWINQNLEEAVQERTAALRAEISERRRAERAKLQAERLAVVGTMAAQVAHEVRNPLGSIKLNLDLIVKEIDALAGTSTHPAAEGQTLVNDMREEVIRIQRVIEEYLKLARLPKLHRERLRLNEFLQQKLPFMYPAFDSAGVQLRTDLDNDLDSIDADAGQLWQAILNLLRNGIEAMPQGGTLTVSTRRDGDRARLSVTDTGIGMTGEELQQVFVPFFSTKPGGTGLGLVLSQQILNEHGAHIECSSSAGEGSTFTIHFPLL